MNIYTYIKRDRFISMDIWIDRKKNRKLDNQIQIFRLTERQTGRQMQATATVKLRENITAILKILHKFSEELR